jgi:hypothetical protein
MQVRMTNNIYDSPASVALVAGIKPSAAFDADIVAEVAK